MSVAPEGGIAPLPRNLGDPEPELRVAAVGGIQMPLPCFLDNALELGAGHEIPQPHAGFSPSYFQSNIMAQIRFVAPTL